ncbi:MAG: hypothetical protein V1872_10875, partial [bacterium]
MIRSRDYLTCRMFIILLMFLSIGISCCSSITKKHIKPIPSASEENKQFSPRKMSSFLAPLTNNNFESYITQDDGHVTFNNWSYLPSKNNIHNNQLRVGRGYNSKTSLTLVSEKNGYDNELLDEVSTNINIPPDWQSDNMNVSVSAWVWSDTPCNAFLKIESNTGREAISAFHSGNSKWEYLTTVYPFSESISTLKISLLNKKSIARFDDIHPLIILDDRFDGISDYEFRFRERLNYKKNRRIRIVVVGNSTIKGTNSSKNGTFSYVLQSKLESLFPNKFEVMNYGIGSWYLRDQIVSLENNFHFGNLNHDNIFNSSISPISEEKEESLNENIKNATTLKSIQPDIIILSSLWNDINEVIMHNTPFEVGVIDDTPFSILYYQSLYNYMDTPTNINYLSAKNIYELAIQEGEKTVEQLPTTYNEIVNSLYLQKISLNAKLKYDFLMRMFLKRACNLSNIWNLNFPFRGGENYLHYINKIPSHMAAGTGIPEGEIEKLKVAYYPLSIA